MSVSHSQLCGAVLACAALAFPALAQRSPHHELSSADWAGIRAAYQAGRHRVFPDSGGHRARNPGQHWTTLFDNRGFTTTPDAGSWSWGLELLRYGWGRDEREAAVPQSVLAEGGRVAYVWDDRLTEWYVNDRRGLEHGYTVHARPEDVRGPLDIRLSIRGGLVASVSKDGRDVRFVDGPGDTVLTYAGLSVLDAEGRTLAATWETRADGLQLRVEDQGARYPLTIDPIAQQQAYLKASNTGTGDQFGWSVSVSGDTVVVGANLEDSNATGVDGDGSNNLAVSSGAAYVFVRTGTTWSQQAYLKPFNTNGGGFFGTSVAVSGDTIVVGADTVDNAGAAYVFVRTGTTWSQQAYLTASDPGPDRFGWSVSVSGDTIVVAAPQEDSNATGVDGDGSNNVAVNSGAAYVFLRTGATWSQQAYLKASNTGTNDRFGSWVSVSGDTVVVGARLEDSNATGADGDGSNNVAMDSGAAYVFSRVGTTWSQQAYLKASNTGANDRFGGSVSVSGDTVVVGAYLEDSNAEGLGGDESDNSAQDSGAAYVFSRVGTTWSQQAYLKASNTGEGDHFGFSVSVSGETVVVGADSEDGSGNNTPNSGAVYVFSRTGATWGQQAYLKASNLGGGDLFGISVAVSGDTIVGGALFEDSDATGVDGDGSNNAASASGAACVFGIGVGTFTSFGVGCSGSAGVPILAAAPGSSPRIGERLEIQLSAMPTSLDNVPYAFLGLSRTEWMGMALPLDASQFGLWNCTQYISLEYSVDLTNNGGTASWNLDIPNNSSLLGIHFYVQGAVFDFGVNPADLIVTNAAEGVVGRW